MKVTVTSTIYGEAVKSSIGTIKLGDNVWFLHKNFAHQGRVNQINLSLIEVDFEDGGTPYKIMVDYYIVTYYDSFKRLKIKPERAFRSIKELKESINP